MGIGRNAFFSLSILLLTLLINSTIFAQQSDSVKYSAYNLMTEYYNTNFYPFEKKNIYVGFAFSLIDEKAQNEQTLFSKTLDGSDINYSITFKGGYFLNDYFMTGLNLIYEREEFDGSVLIEGDTIARKRVNRIANVVPVIKSYFPLTENHRFSFFNELGIGFGFGKGVSRDTKNTDEITKVNSEEFIFNAGISPGVIFFAIENFSFEIQLNNLIGYTYKQRRSTTNDMEETKVVTNNVNFNVNLLSLRLGLAYYFGTKKQR